MLNMLNDPEIDKLIIYTLAGICAVLMLAVFFLAVKRNIYYVDETGAEVPPPPKKKLFNFSFGKKKKEEEVPVEAPPVMPEEPAVIASATAADVPLSEEDYDESFSLPVFPSEPEEEAAEAVEPAAEEPVVEEPAVIEPEPELNEEEVDAAVDDFLADLPEPDAEEYHEDLTTVLERPEHMPPDPEALTRTSAFDIDDEEYEEGQEPVPTGVEVAVVIGNNVREYSINQLPCLIGRESSTCDLVISEPAVSRRHARILVVDRQLCIEDVSEHNGTFLNMTKLPSLGRAILKAGDRITLGRATIDVTKVLYE